MLKHYVPSGRQAGRQATAGAGWCSADLSKDIRATAVDFSENSTDNLVLVLFSVLGSMSVHE